MAEANEVHVTVLRTLADIEPFRDLWTQLCQHRDADLDFYSFIVGTRPGATPFVLLLKAGAESSFVVGRLETVQVESKVGYVRLPTPALRVLEFIHGGALGPIDAPRARAVVAHVRTMLRRGEVDAVRLHYADVESPLFVEMADLKWSHAQSALPQLTPHRLRNLTRFGADFGSSISRNERSNQRRREKQLVAACSGRMRIDPFRSESDVERLIEDAERVAAKSYQRGIKVGFTATETTRERLRLLARKGWLRAWIMYLDDQPAAFWIGALRGGAFASDYLAYDAALSHLAPGTYLTMKVLEEMQHVGSEVRVVDFGLGDAPYKARFGTDLRMTANLHLFASTWRGTYVGSVHAAAEVANSAAKALLDQFGLLDRLKKRQRQRAAGV